jgi:hypothetical protein
MTTQIVIDRKELQTPCGSARRRVDVGGVALKLTWTLGRILHGSGCLTPPFDCPDIPKGKYVAVSKFILADGD